MRLLDSLASFFGLGHAVKALAFARRTEAGVAGNAFCFAMIPRLPPFYKSRFTNKRPAHRNIVARSAF